MSFGFPSLSQWIVQVTPLGILRIPFDVATPSASAQFPGSGMSFHGSFFHVPVLGSVLSSGRRFALSLHLSLLQFLSVQSLPSPAIALPVSRRLKPSMSALLTGLLPT